MAPTKRESFAKQAFKDVFGGHTEEITTHESSSQVTITEESVVQETFSQGGFTQTGFSEGGFTSTSGGFSQGGFSSEGFTQGGFASSGGFSQGGFSQGGFTELNPDNDKKPIRKRIIICCDGTWQSAVSGKKSSPSNITRLCRVLNGIGTNADGQWQQVVWYDSGVGTTSYGLDPKIEGAIGRGLEGNVVEAYNFCALNWNKGDKIYCFGFSRGAYTARTIAGLISDIGICDKEKLGLFPELWELYKAYEFAEGESFYTSRAYYEWMEGKPSALSTAPITPGVWSDPMVWERRAQGDWAQPGSREVELVGVFDTVGALGIPEILGVQIGWPFFSKPSEWHNIRLSPRIKHAVQALALDDHRNAFSPSLYYVPKLTRPTQAKIKEAGKAARLAQEEWDILLSERKADKQTILRTHRKMNDTARAVARLQDDHDYFKPSKLTQVWFPGYHINIGGGSDDTLKNKGDMEEMSSITFAWMLEQIRDHLSINELTFIREKVQRYQHFKTLNAVHAEYEAKITAQKEADAKAGWGEWLWRKSGDLASAVFSREEAPKFYKYGWGTGDMEDSYSITYKLNGSKTRTPGGYFGPKHDTFEEVHPTLGYRVEHYKGYFPSGLKKGEYERRKLSNGRYMYKIGKKELPEWRLGGGNSFERRVVPEEAYDYVAALDKELGQGPFWWQNGDVVESHGFQQPLLQ